MINAILPGTNHQQIVHHTDWLLSMSNALLGKTKWPTRPPRHIFALTVDTQLPFT